MIYPTTQEIDHIYQQQVDFKSRIKYSKPSKRKEWLKSLRKNILEREQAIKEALNQDFQKSPIETDITEIFPVLVELKNVMKGLTKWMGSKSVRSPLFFKTIKANIHYEPKGNTLIITPWNYPFQLPLVHLISSVAAGNTVMLKLSENTPHTNKVIKQIISETFDPQHVAVIEGEIAETTHLLSLKFDHIHFTGSPAVGKIIMQSAAKHLADITLELGGKSPVFIDKSIDIKKVVQNIIWAKFLNAGQTCIAPDYLLVDRSIKYEIEADFKQELIKAFGSEAIQSPDLARIINVRQFDRLQNMLKDLETTYTTWIYGGKTDRAQRYIEPTVLTSVPMDSSLMREEIFGPILPIIYYTDLEDALATVSAQEKPLALYIFSKNKTYIDHVVSNTTAGGTTVNDAMVHILHPNLPFGGVNNSGIGQSLGHYGFKDFSHERAVAHAKIFPMTKFFWYPYNAKTNRLLNWVKKIF